MDVATDQEDFLHDQKNDPLIIAYNKNSDEWFSFGGFTFSRSHFTLKNNAHYYMNRLIIPRPYQHDLIQQAHTSNFFLADQGAYKTCAALEKSYR